MARRTMVNCIVIRLIKTYQYCVLHASVHELENQLSCLAYFLKFVEKIVC